MTVQGLIRHFSPVMVVAMINRRMGIFSYKAYRWVMIDGLLFLFQHTKRKNVLSFSELDEKISTSSIYSKYEA